MHASLWTFAVLLALIPAASLAQHRSPAAQEHCPSSRTLQEKETFGIFEVQVYRGENLDGCVRVLRNGRRVFSKHTEWKFVIGNDINKESGNEVLDKGVFHAPRIAPGTDITGRGKPDLILAEWSGGAHCCFSFHVIELGDVVREIATVKADDSDYAHFEDVNQDGIYEFIGYDYAFAYWRAGFMQSPAPQVILRFDGKSYELAPDLMRKPVPSSSVLSKQREAVRKSEWEEESPPTQLWATMLDLIYTGNSDVAWKFFSETWPSKRAGSKAFLRSFCGQLATSRYFAQLRPTIKNAPCTFNLKYADRMR